MKALALYSGGLDSSLAVRLILDQGIEVIALHVITPLSRFDEAKSKFMQEQLEGMGAKLKLIYLQDDFAAILQNPKFGYGKNLNPCVDCKILMLKYAKFLMREMEASFVVTGEVLAQRPKSQHRDSLHVIEKESGLRDLVLRPLSAKLLKPTLPELNGWVDRERLLAFNGRSRNPRISRVRHSTGCRRISRL